MLASLIAHIRDTYRSCGPVPLHAPRLGAGERAAVLEAIDSTFVSSVGAHVDRFEQEVAAYTGVAAAVATVNGTAALHTALHLCGTAAGDLVITQPLTFVATCNAIRYTGADPVFVDVERDTLGLSPIALAAWLDAHAERDETGTCRHRASGRVVRAVVPMHTFGHPARLEALLAVCEAWQLPLIEDAAEALGSLRGGRHAGSFGAWGTLSFNGNKIITTGGGGMLLCDPARARRARHVTTTAKQPHAWHFVHDELGFNYRMPNLNAALGCAQLARIEQFVAAKRTVAAGYRAHLRGSGWAFVDEPAGCRSNFWLNALLCDDAADRDAFLQATNAQGVMTRPAWTLMNELPLFEGCLQGELPQARWLADRLVNLPSSVPP
jgi:aminotransferase in exopolysaccharide biosynthesis